MPIPKVNICHLLISLTIGKLFILQNYWLTNYLHEFKVLLNKQTQHSHFIHWMTYLTILTLILKIEKAFQEATIYICLCTTSHYISYWVYEICLNDHYFIVLYSTQFIRILNQHLHLPVKHFWNAVEKRTT